MQPASENSSWDVGMAWYLPNGRSVEKGQSR